MPRKLMSPKPLTSFTAPGVRRTKLDQRPPLMGRPPMAPSVVDCAKPPDVHKNNAMIIAMDTKHALKRKNPVSFSRMDIPPREHMERCAASTYSALSRGVKGWLPFVSKLCIKADEHTHLFYTALDSVNGLSCITRVK